MSVSDVFDGNQNARFAAQRTPTGFKTHLQDSIAFDPLLRGDVLLWAVQ